MLTGSAANIYTTALTVYADDTVYNIFPDVTESDWFFADVAKLKEAGVVNGYPDGYFHPEREMTAAEFIKIISPNAVIEPNYVNTLFPEHWASGYINYAYDNGIITDSDLASGFDPDSKIDRYTMVKMTVAALNIEIGEYDCPFADTTDKYAAAAYNECLVRGYIGVDDLRIFDGEKNVIRSEAVAVAVRISEYRTATYDFKKNAIIENAKNNILTTERELIDLFYILNREFITEFQFTTSVSTRLLREYCEKSNVLNLEYFYNAFTNVTSLGDGNYVITIQYLPSIETVKNYHAKALETADRIVSDVITSEMTDLEKITALHDYLVANCEYDIENYNAGTITQESRLAYGALVNKKAVCQGYCAAFALLCDRAGVRCIVVGGNAPNSRDSHAWNMVLIDGETYHIDTTHDDPVPDKKGTVSKKYFCLTSDKMISYGYTWDKKRTELKYFY